MAYTRHDWDCGETITADKMNNIEDGIEAALDCCEGGGGTLIITTRTETLPDVGTVLAMDKTWQEIFDAFPNVCVVTGEYEKDKVDRIYTEDDYFYVNVGNPSIFTEFYTDSADGHPFTESGPL